MVKKHHAIKGPPPLMVQGHQFVLYYFRQPTFCSKCDGFIWGVATKQGFSCSACRLAVHKTCVNDVAVPCARNPETLTSDTNPHIFQVHNYKKPTYCDQCGSMLYGLVSQGVKCKGCKKNVHKRCQKKVYPNCIINAHEPLGKLKLRILLERSGDTPNGVIVKIHALRADALLGTNLNTIVKFKTSMDKAKTKPEKKNCPIWNETLVLKAVNTPEEKLIVTVVDKSGFTDVFLGGMTFTMTKLLNCPNCAEDSWYRLLGKQQYGTDFVRVYVNPDQQNYGPNSSSLSSEFKQNDSGQMAFIYGDPAIDAFLDAGKCVGFGSFGCVFIANKKGKPDDRLALKAVPKTTMQNEEDVEMIFAEARMALLPPNPFIVQTLFYLNSKDVCYIGMEFIPNGDLLKFVQVMKPVPVDITSTIYSQILLGIEYLHTKLILYRDVKLDNVMIDSNGFAKVTDFGLVKQLKSKKDITGSYCGTLYYMAPEILNLETYTFSVDIWSLGIFLYALFFDTFPFFTTDETTEDELIMQVTHRRFDALIPEFYNIPEMTQLFDWMTAMDPSKRPSFSAIKGSKFYQNFNWKQMESGKIPAIPLDYFKSYLSKKEKFDKKNSPSENVDEDMPKDWSEFKYEKFNDDFLKEELDKVPKVVRDGYQI